MLNKRTFRHCQKQTLMHVGNQIFKYCKDSGLSIEELKGYQNVSYRLYKTWTQGKGEIKFPVLMAIAKILNKKVVVTLEDLEFEDFID